MAYHPTFLICFSAPASTEGHHDRFASMSARRFVEHVSASCATPVARPSISYSRAHHVPRLCHRMRRIGRRHRHARRTRISLSRRGGRFSSAQRTDVSNAAGGATRRREPAPQEEVSARSPLSLTPSFRRQASGRFPDLGNRPEGPERTPAVRALSHAGGRGHEELPPEGCGGARLCLPAGRAAQGGIRRPRRARRRNDPHVCLY